MKNFSGILLTAAFFDDNQKYAFWEFEADEK